jgi:hypothetical protein
MFAFLSRLVSCTSESGLPKDDIVPKKDVPADGDAASSPPAAAAAAQAVMVPPTPAASTAVVPDTKGLFVTHADPSAAKEPFVSYGGNHAKACTVADALAAKSSAKPTETEDVAAVGATIAAAAVTKAIDDGRKSEYLAYWAPDAFSDSALTTKKEFEESLKLPVGARCMLERAARGIADPSAPPKRAAPKNPPPVRVYLD